MQELVIATNNPSKARELASILGRQWPSLKLRMQSEFSLPSPAETGNSYTENALIKAYNTYRHTKLPTVADDSGLEVEALNGAPGIYSARYAGKSATDAQNRRHLRATLAPLGQSLYPACFFCAAVCVVDDQTPPISCFSKWNGFITTEEAGTQGFGYDPVFYLPDFGCTAAALPQSTKNACSHRALAFTQLIQRLTISPYFPAGCSCL